MSIQRGRFFDNRGILELRMLEYFRRNFLLSINLRMDAAHWPETSIAVYQATLHRIPQLSNLRVTWSAFVY